MSNPENLNQPTVEEKDTQEQEKADREAMLKSAERVRNEVSKQKAEAQKQDAKLEKLLIDTLLDIDAGTYYRIVNKTGEKLLLSPKGDLFLKPKKQANDAKVYTGKLLSDVIGNARILELVQEGKISLEPLDIAPDVNYKLTNRTAVRIHIANFGKGRYADQARGDLVIPPLGSRKVNSETLKWYKFVEWQRQDLIRVEPEDDASRELKRFFEILFTWLTLLPGLVLVALMGFGIPLWVVYYFGGGANLIQSFVSGEMFASDQQALMGLGRLFQVVFICVASVLPALFFYLFGRQQVEKLRQRFFRDILVLDPNLYTLSEAETKYDTLLSSAYGSSSSSSPFTILLLMFSTAILAMGWILTIAPSDPLPVAATSLVNFFDIKTSPFTLGFLGIYFFAINMVFRRYVRADLTPKTYANITVRMLVAFVLVWAINVLPGFSDDSSGFLALAFTIGVFPENGFRLIRDAARNFIKRVSPGSQNQDQDNDEKYPLTALEGLHKYDQARLLEEGIENIENLAHHNLVELLAYTRIPSERLIDMFDQSILYLHLGLFDDKDGSGSKLLQKLKSLGVRTATDLTKLIELRKKSLTPEKILSDDEFARLGAVHETFSDDGWLSFIKSWRGTFSPQLMKATWVEDPNRFYLTDFEDPQFVIRRKISEVADYFRLKDPQLSDLLVMAGMNTGEVKQPHESPDAEQDEESKSVNLLEASPVEIKPAGQMQMDDVVVAQLPAPTEAERGQEIEEAQNQNLSDGNPAVG